MSKGKYFVVPSEGRPLVYLVKQPGGRGYVARDGKIQFSREKAERIARQENALKEES